MHGLAEIRAMNDRAAEKELLRRSGVRYLPPRPLAEEWVENAIEDARDLLARVDVEEVARLEGMIEGYSNVLHYIRTGRS